MKKAKKSGRGDQVFPISELTTADNGSLLCLECGASIQYVSGHTKESSKRPVSAYLKLWQKESHNADCIYNLKKFIELLVAESKNVESVDSIFEALAGGNYVFRMNLLVEAQQVAEGLARATSDSEREQQFVGKKYVKSGKHIDSYFRSAAGVAKLRSMIEKSELKNLESSIQISYKDAVIKWRDFYYDDDSYHLLVDKVKKGKLKHPVAVSVTAKELMPLNANAKKFPWEITCYKQIAGEDSKKKAYNPKIRTINESLQTSFSVDETYLVVGEVWDGGGAAHSPWFDIRVVNSAQWVKE